MINQNRSFIKFLLLSIITFGLYGLYFMTTLTSDVNTVCEGDNESTTNFFIMIILGCITCGLYPFWWYYKLGNRLNKAGHIFGVDIPDSGTTFIFYAILSPFTFGLISLLLFYRMIDDVNKLSAAYNARNYGATFNNNQY